VRFRVSIGEEGTPDDAESLYRWLAADPDIRESAELSLASSVSGGGEMSPLLDVINVVLSNSIASASLLVTVLTAWRSSRERPPEIKVEAHGVTVTIADGDQRALPELAEKLSPVPFREAAADGGPSVPEGGE